MIPDFVERTGPQHTLLPDTKPLDYLFKFLPGSLFETVAEETQ